VFPVLKRRWFIGPVLLRPDGRTGAPGRLKLPGRLAVAWLVAAVVFWMALVTPAPALTPAVLAAEEQAPAGLEDPQILLQVFDLIRRHYAGDARPEDLIRGALRGMMGALGDRHSVFFTPEEFRQFTSDLQRSYGGVGMQIGTNADGEITVIAPFPNTPADRAGLRAGDVILAVDGEDVKDLALDQVAARIRGEPGTTVTLTIRREGVSEPFQVELVREVIQIHTVEAEVIAGEGRGISGPVGYLRIISFNDGTTGEVRRNLELLERQGIVGLVLDLRRNPGGMLHEAVGVAELFVPAGPVVHVDWKEKGRETIASRSPGRPYPVVTLVDEGTASGSEIVAGAIQDRGVGPLVGTRTYGKGSVQSLYELNGGNLGAVKLTTARYVTPGGRVIDGTGLSPDVVVHRTEQAPGPEPAPELGIETPLRFTRTLRRGVVGLDVLALQERLAALGHPPGPADGVFGPQTEAALRAFQSGRGLPVTGTLDEAGLQALEQAVMELIRGQAAGSPAKEVETGDLQLERALDVLKERLATSAAGR